MSIAPTDPRRYADWLRVTGNNTRRNGLDAIADEMERLRGTVDLLRTERDEILARAAHEAWLAARAGASPDEITSAVLAIAKRTSGS